MNCQPSAGTPARRGIPWPVDFNHCEDCRIRIFHHPDEAAAAGVKFHLTINGAIGNQCWGCATNEKEIPMTAEKKVVEKLKDATAEPAPGVSILAFERNVDPPPAERWRKYGRLETLISELTIQKNGRSDWCRFKFATQKIAYLAKTHVLTLRRKKYHAQGWTVNCRLVSDTESTVTWLYVQRLTYTAKLEDQA